MSVWNHPDMKSEPLVLLPGMMCDSRLFAPQIKQLSSEREIHTFPLASEDTVEALAANLLEQAPSVFALAGLSMGGIVAMEVIRQAPERVTRLALLDTNPLAEAPDRATAREPQIAAVNNGKLHEVMRDEMKPHYLCDGPRRQQILDLCMEMALTLGPQVFTSQSRALQTRADQTSTLAQVAVPTLILCGEHDALCPVERHEMMHELVAGSTLVVISDAGHLPTLEQPEKTIEALHHWLN